MELIVFISLMLSFALLVLILSPFWLGEGGRLAPSACWTDPDKVAKAQQLVVQRYLQDENSFRQGAISKAEWEKRKQFLTHRYLDFARRADYLAHGREEES